MSTAAKPLSVHLKDKYKMAPGYGPGVYSHRGITVDLSQCTESEADEIIGVGCKVIIKAKSQDANAKK